MNKNVRSVAESRLTVLRDIIWMFLFFTRSHSRSHSVVLSVVVSIFVNLENESRKKKTV